MIGASTEVANFGTTRLLRAFAPLLRDGGRLFVVASRPGTLHHLAPVLHDHFDGLPSLDEVDARGRGRRPPARPGHGPGGPGSLRAARPPRPGRTWSPAGGELSVR
ncbi:hypothetical protein [Nonomuraea sp. NPDC049309]|uniref:hypothetical protein n=1 Tax=Nonomuraea sp. NPDC049309 TaxID=3364350 RepID=UPI0037235B46